MIVKCVKPGTVSEANGRATRCTTTATTAGGSTTAAATPTRARIDVPYRGSASSQIATAISTGTAVWRPSTATSSPAHTTQPRRSTSPRLATATPSTNTRSASIAGASP